MADKPKLKAGAKNRLKFKLDMRWLVLVLLAIIAGMLAFWRPWQPGTSGRSIDVSGQAEVEAEPDEFVFSPVFEKTGSNQATLKDDVADLVDEAISALKALGVEDKDIKLSAYGGDNYYYVYPAERDGTYRVSATLTVTSKSRDMAQTIQDYLDTTSASGQLTPVVQFSKDKSRELESQARQEAIADARAKAEHSTNLLGAKLGKVLEVSETSGFDIFPMASRAEIAQDSSSSQGLPVQPGLNQFTYSVNVKFEIR